MDEEDGRLGPRGPQLGRFDVLTDAATKSLRHTPKQISTGTHPGPGIWCHVSAPWRRDQHTPNDLFRKTHHTRGKL